MITESKIQAHIENTLEAKMEGMGPEELEEFSPKEHNILPDVIEALEAEGHDPEHLDSGGFYWRLKANWNDILDSEWFDRTLEEQTREAWDAKEESKHPYAYRGLTRGDFYA